MAHAVGADVVVVHPPFRWQQEYAARLRRRHRGARGVDRASRSRSRTCTPGGPRRGAAWRCTCPAGTPRRSPTPTPRSTSRTPRSRGPTPSRWPSGSATGCATSTSPTAPARPRTSTWCPGRGAMGAAELPAAPRAAPASTATSCSRSTPARPRTREERERDLRESLEFAREHFVGRRGARLSAASRRPPRPPPGRARTPGPRSWPRPGRRSPSTGFAGTTIRAVAAAAGVDAALVHHYFGTKDDLFLAALELPVDPREVIGAGRRRRAVDGAGERLLRVFLAVWDDPATPAAAARRWSRGAARPGRPSGCCARGSCRWCSARSGAALGLDRPELRMPLVASQLVGLDPAATCSRLEPLASMPADDRRRDVRARRSSATSPAPLPRDPAPVTARRTATLTARPRQRWTCA